MQKKYLLSEDETRCVCNVLKDIIIEGCIEDSEYEQTEFYINIWKKLWLMRNIADNNQFAMEKTCEVAQQMIKETRRNVLCK